MYADTKATDLILDRLLEGPCSEGGQEELVRDLVWRGAALPDELLERAWRRLMERVSE